MTSYEKYQLKDGSRRWRIYWRTPEGKERNKSGFERKTDAEQWAARNITVKIGDGTYVDPKEGRIKIGILGDKWIETQEALLKPSAYRPVESAWRLHVKPQWENTPVNRLRHSDIQEWVNGLAADYSATIVKRCHGILNGILKTAISDGRIAVNPLRDVKTPAKQRKPHVYLTVAQLETLADLCGSHRLLVLVLGYCGLRFGEARGLTVRNIDFDRARLRIIDNRVKVGATDATGTPKSNEYRDVPVPASILGELRGHCGNMQPDDLVFTDDDGKPLRYQSPKSRGWWRNALNDANRLGIPDLVVHDLRHTAASIAVSSGATVKAVQRMLGHSSAAMTLDVYADLFSDDLDDVAARMDSLIVACRTGRKHSNASTEHD